MDSNFTLANVCQSQSTTLGGSQSATQQTADPQRGASAGIISAKRTGSLPDAAIALFQIGFLCVITWVGHRGVALTHLPLPGNVAGLAILFVLVWSRLVPLHWVERGADLLIRHLGLFFLPIAAGFLTLGNVTAGHGIAIGVTLIGSTAVGFTVTASIAELTAWLLNAKT